MREEATSRGRRWISPSIHNVVVAHLADSATIAVRAQFNNAFEVMSEWIGGFRQNHITPPGLA